MIKIYRETTLNIKLAMRNYAPLNGCCLHKTNEILVCQKLCIYALSIFLMGFYVNLNWHNYARKQFHIICILFDIKIIFIRQTLLYI